MIGRLEAGDYTPHVGKLRPSQVVARSSWQAVPDENVVMASLHSIHVVPDGFSTTTFVNPLDPATVNWYETPVSNGRTVPAGRLV